MQVTRDNLSLITQIVEIVEEALILRVSSHKIGKDHEKMVIVPILEESDHISLGEHITQSADKVLLALISH